MYAIIDIETKEGSARIATFFAIDNRDIQVILKQYLKSNRVEKIIEF